jgi:hypothetical protein
VSECVFTWHSHGDFKSDSDAVTLTRAVGLVGGSARRLLNSASSARGRAASSSGTLHAREWASMWCSGLVM